MQCSFPSGRDKPSSFAGTNAAGDSDSPYRWTPEAQLWCLPEASIGLRSLLRGSKTR